jgi:hypothetical protein
MNSSLCSSITAGSEQVQLPPEVSPAERRSLRSTEVVYAIFALAVGLLFFATAV